MTEAYEWSGRVGATWAELWRRTDRSFGALAEALDAAIAARAPQGPFRAIDIGCGAGATSIALAAARPDATIIGIDISDELVAVACARAATITGTSFVVGDALVEARRHAPVDLLFSRHGVMFFDDAVAGFAALHDAAAPGAALVFSCFRDRALNPWAEEVARALLGEPPPQSGTGPGPFAFADRDHVRALLAAAGWRDVVAEPVDYRYHAGEGDDPVGDTVDFFSRIGPAAPLLRAAAADERPALLARVTDVAERYRNGRTVDFPAAAWIWSARA